MRGKRENIEAIYPLTSLQQALLIHHVNADIDQGQLTVQFEIEGLLEVERFKQAWRLVVARHETLRSTIHYENLSKPVRIVHKAVSPVIVGETPTGGKLKLSKAPVDVICLDCQTDRYTKVYWTCHHILLDGWSTAIIMQDFCTAYDALESGKSPDWPSIPSYKSLLQWRRQHGVTAPSADGAIPKATPIFDRPKANAKYDQTTISLPIEFINACSAMSTAAGTTQSIWIQAVWACALSAWSSSKAITFGLTRSGRNIEFPAIDRMVGLFVQEIPVALQVNGEMPFTDLLDIVHRKNLKINDLESRDFDANPVDMHSHSAIESMLTFENIPVSQLTTESLTISTFSSGITSTYPFSLVMIPGEEASLTLHHRLDAVSSQEARQILDALIEIGIEASKANTTVHLLAEKMPQLQSLKDRPADGFVDEAQLRYTQPENGSQLKLVKFWESLLSYSPVGIDQNFFELGGSSLMALRLLGRIETEMGKTVSAAEFLQRPTIRSLAAHIQNGASERWSSIVPLRAKGDKAPIYCIHAGGAHVFFYQPLARNLGTDQPVYGIQPMGLNGEQEMHSTIEEMALHYWTEIKSIQPEGPWILLGYCFSVPVCIEMNRLIRQEGGEARVLIVDSGPWFEDGPDEITLSERMSKLITIVHNRNWRRLGDIIEEKTKKIRGKYLSRLESTHSANLLKMEQALRSVYYRYEWQPFDGKVTLVRSSEFAERPDKEFHLEEWSALALGGLDVIVVAGRHKTLFEDPDAVNLANGISDYLADR